MGSVFLIIQNTLRGIIGGFSFYRHAQDRGNVHVSMDLQVQE